MSDYIQVGSVPANVTWSVVRGDTATLLVNFLEDDQKTAKDTSSWTFSASAYNQRTETRYTLETESSPGSVTITADPDTTEEWGTGVAPVVAQLTYDLQVTLEDDVVWTPIVGSINVIGDVTGANL
jgi:hypothetical protein